MREAVVNYIVLLRPALLVVVGLTLVLWLVMSLCIRKLKVQGQQTQVAGLFVGLGGRSLIHLSFAWVKWAVYVAFLVLSEPVELVHWMLLGGLAMATLVLAPKLSHLATEVIGGLLMGAGLAVCSTLLQYLRQVRYDVWIHAAYWLLAAFLILASVAVLLREVATISEERKHFDETGETE